MSILYNINDICKIEELPLKSGEIQRISGSVNDSDMCQYNIYDVFNNIKVSQYTVNVSFTFFLYQNRVVEHALMQQSLFIFVVVSVAVFLFAFALKHFDLVFMIASLKHFCGLVD